MFNIVYADKEGTIFYLYNGLFPERVEGYDWSLYLPGSSRDLLWDEYLPLAQRPQVFNPPAGFVQNANSTPFSATLGVGNPNLADFSPTLGIEPQNTNRAMRLLTLLGDDPAITSLEFFAIQV